MSRMEGGKLCNMREGVERGREDKSVKMLLQVQDVYQQVVVFFLPLSISQYNKLHVAIIKVPEEIIVRSKAVQATCTTEYL